MVEGFDDSVVLRRTVPAVVAGVLSGRGDDVVGDGARVVGAVVVGAVVGVGAGLVVGVVAGGGGAAVVGGGAAVVGGGEDGAFSDMNRWVVQIFPLLPYTTPTPTWVNPGSTRFSRCPGLATKASNSSPRSCS